MHLKYFPLTFTFVVGTKLLRKGQKKQLYSTMYNYKSVCWYLVILVLIIHYPKLKFSIFTDDQKH